MCPRKLGFSFIMVSWRFFFLFMTITSCSWAIEDVPSFRSSWNEGGKPILRLGNELPEPVTAPPVAREEESGQPRWVEDLRVEIFRFVTRYGYEKAKPHITKLVDDTENKQHVLLRVEVNRDGHSEVKFKPYKMRVAEPGPPSPSAEPAWVNDFKSFIKSLISRYGRDHLDEHMKPVIKYVENLHHVAITDLDVNEYGDIILSYVNKPRSVVSEYLDT